MVTAELRGAEIGAATMVYWCDGSLRSFADALDHNAIRQSSCTTDNVRTISGSRFLF